MLDPRVCYRAVRARDARFDGRIFVAVKTTGIYCRPVCPARPAKLENLLFYPSAAAAQEAGFRPCLRCRPETAPHVGSWRGTSNTVARALALIEEGALDDAEANVDVLAERLGIGSRQLRRLFRKHLGASPVAVAQTRRVLFAKQLLHETMLPMGEVALAAGFGSVRRFNEVFHDLYGRPPSELRRIRRGADRAMGVTLRLRYRAPYDWAAMLGYLRARAIDGVERVDADRYARTFVHDGETGSVDVRHAPAEQSVVVTVRHASVRALPAVVARVRRLFDLSADVSAIGAHLGRDPLVAPLVARRPGLRVPGAWDGFELGVRAVLGQQVTVEAARKLGGHLARLCGSAMTAPEGTLRLAFPHPAQVAGTDLGSLPMPAARKRALTALARASLDDPRLFEPLATVEDTVARLRAIPGVGDWTASYIALRAAHEPDALPAADAGLLRSASRRTGGPVGASELRERAERWRPWRAYAAQHLWAADSSARSPNLGDTP